MKVFSDFTVCSHYIFSTREFTPNGILTPHSFAVVFSLGIYDPRRYLLISLISEAMTAIYRYSAHAPWVLEGSNASKFK